MLNIRKGLKPRPVKLVIYGPEGIGKSTLAAQCPDALFIDLEGGTSTMDVMRVDPAPATWRELIDIINEVACTPGACKTLVVDSADWAEMICVKAVIEQSGKAEIKGIEDFGYGKGYTYVMEKYQELMRALDGCIVAGINVVVTAHAAMKKIELPEERGQFDHWGMKLSKQTGPLLKEWADALLFCTYQTDVMTDDKTKRNYATGGKRVIHTAHNPVWDAKNRFGFPETMDMSYDSIKVMFVSHDMDKVLLEKLSEGGYTPGEILPMLTAYCADKGATMEEAERWAADNFDKASEWMDKRRK